MPRITPVLEQKPVLSAERANLLMSKLDQHWDNYLAAWQQPSWPSLGARLDHLVALRRDLWAQQRYRTLQRFMARTYRELGQRSPRGFNQDHIGLARNNLYYQLNLLALGLREGDP